MITLTDPALVKAVLGGTATVGYDKFVLNQITYDTVAQSITSQIRITSTAQPEMQAINGRLTITCATARLEIQVDSLDFYRRIALTGPQNTSVQNQIRDAQNALESGLITLAVVAGVQTTGA
jgi:hypothetical protein